MPAHKRDNQLTKTERARRNAQGWGAANGAQEGASIEELKLPSGFTVDVRRPPLMAWLVSGRVPERFVSAVTKGSGAAAGQTLEHLEGDELMGMLTFMRDLVMETVVAPRIRQGAPPDSTDEISPERIPDRDFFAIIEWALGVSVKLTDGTEMSAAALSSFRSDENLRGDSVGGGAVRAAAE